MTRRFFLAGAVALMATLPVLRAVAETGPQSTLDILSGDTRHRFAVEIADDPAERSRGLMFRTEMADDAGMLFIYAREQVASFWMKNTFIPLDMLFIADDGTILQIAPDAEPHSLDPVRSDMAVRAVLEIKGGLSAALGIEIGDKIALYR